MKMNAALSLCVFRWRSMQLKLALILPPTNHFQNGGLLLSGVLDHFFYQGRSSAYSSKRFGKFSSEKRLSIDGSLRFACATKLAGGWMYCSSFQWTAICA